MVSSLKAPLALSTPSSCTQQYATKNEIASSGTGSVQFFSLRTKLLLFAAALVLIPGGIYGAITLSSSRAALAQVVGRQLVEEARGGADRLTTALRARSENLRSFAAQDVMREIRIHDLDKRISSLLASVKRSCRACIELRVLDRHDKVVASSNPRSIGKVETTIRAGDNSTVTIEGPFLAGRARTYLRFTVPVPDPDEHASTIGRLVALFDWERETGVIRRVRENLRSVGADADALILDARGIVIGGSAAPDGPWQLGDAIALRLSKANKAAVGYVDPDAGMLVGVARLPGDLPTWTIIIAEPLAEAFAPARRMANLLGTTLAGTLLVAFGVALLAAGRVTRPLATLTRAAEKVGRGESPTSAVSVHSHDEIGTFTAAFNRMAADLKRAERELVDAAKFSFVGELAAGVAHEVRTPLGVLRCSAQLLERSLEVKDEDSRELLRLLRDEVDRIEHVVSALLELGRPHQMRLEASPLGHILFRAADFVDVRARHQRITIRRRAIKPDPIIVCDPELIYQVALNLLVNAVQVLPEGGLVEVSTLPARDGYAGFEVCDDGPGMTEAIRARIFQPFFTRREGGTGLGLTFVQRVVQEHRGRISVDSEVGEGTVLRVTLPVAAALR